jgi:hypothetical protein
MTAGQTMMYKMVRSGPYAGNDPPEHGGGAVCGFCGETPAYHRTECPWPKFRDGILATWPEWLPDLNEYDQQERLDREHEWREL